MALHYVLSIGTLTIKSYLVAPTHFKFPRERADNNKICYVCASKSPQKFTFLIFKICVTMTIAWCQIRSSSGQFQLDTTLNHRVSMRGCQIRLYCRHICGDCCDYSNRCGETCTLRVAVFLELGDPGLDMDGESELGS